MVAGAGVATVVPNASAKHYVSVARYASVCVLLLAGLMASQADSISDLFLFFLAWLVVWIIAEAWFIKIYFHNLAYFYYNFHYIHLVRIVTVGNFSKGTQTFNGTSLILTR